MKKGDSKATRVSHSMRKSEVVMMRKLHRKKNYSIMVAVLLNEEKSKRVVMRMK